MAATALWQHLWNSQAPTPGLEHLRLEGRRADSVLLAFDEQGCPYRLGYRLEYSQHWRPRHLHVRVDDERGTRELRLHCNRSGEWRDSAGTPLPQLSGCLDLDLWPTPFTNSPAIWRLDLAQDQREEIAVAYIEAPSLDLRVMRQAYTRLDARHLLYQNLDGDGFHAVLTLGDDGLVEDYPGLFRRLRRWAQQGPPPPKALERDLREKSRS